MAVKMKIDGAEVQVSSEEDVLTVLGVARKLREARKHLRHRTAVKPTTPDGHLVAAASVRLGSDTAVATALGLSRTQLSRVRGGGADLSAHRRDALRALADGKPAPPRQPSGRVMVALNDAEAARLRDHADERGIPLSALLSEAILEWVAEPAGSAASSPKAQRRAPAGTRWRSYRVDPWVMVAMNERIGTASPGPSLRAAVLKKIDRGA